MLPYVTGGVAFAEVKLTSSFIATPGAFGPFPASSASTSSTLVGWTAGAGIEWAFTPEWSVKLEYNYYGFGTKSVLLEDTTVAVGTNAPVNINQNIQVVLLGVNFHARSGPDW